MKRIAAATLLSLSGSFAGAVPVVYEVNRYPYGPIAITGTIETDGTVGVVQTANVLAWSLVLSDPSTGSAQALSSMTGKLTIVGTHLIATAGDLQFLFQDPFHGQDFVSF